MTMEEVMMEDLVVLEEEVRDGTTVSAAAVPEVATAEARGEPGSHGTVMHPGAEVDRTTMDPTRIIRLEQILATARSK